jgi:hypothetical protein
LYGVKEGKLEVEGSCAEGVGLTPLEEEGMMAMIVEPAIAGRDLVVGYGLVEAADGHLDGLVELGQHPIEEEVEGCALHSESSLITSSVAPLALVRTMVRLRCWQRSPIATLVSSRVAAPLQGMKRVSSVTGWPRALTSISLLLEFGFEHLDNFGRVTGYAPGLALHITPVDAEGFKGELVGWIVYVMVLQSVSAHGCGSFGWASRW